MARYSDDPGYDPGPRRQPHRPAGPEDRDARSDRDDRPARSQDERRPEGRPEAHHGDPHHGDPQQPYTPPDAAELGGYVRRRWWLALLVGIVAAAAAFGGLQLVPTRYAATVTIVVQIPGTSADTEALVRTVEALITSSVVLGDIAFNSQTGLSPRAVDDRMTIDRPAGSAVIEVAVTDSSRARARAIAREIVPVLKRRIGESSGDIESGAQIAVDSFGNGPEVEQVDLPVIQIVGVAGVAGTGLGVLLVLFLAGRHRRRTYRPMYAA